VRKGPDRLLYAVKSEDPGALLRLEPGEGPAPAAVRQSMHKHSRGVLFLVLAALASACGASPTSPTPATTSAPYSQVDVVVGTGTVVNTGSRVTVAYAGWLHDSSKTDAKGTQFDTSTSFAFQVGLGQVIKGWDQGVPGMRVGGTRRLVLPPDLAYGSSGAGPIPPNATLVFDISLLSVQ
jgi:FKBP-type peptidyl-prolyl cis-trans isomerase FkpA